MDRNFSYIIAPGEDGLTIERYLAARGYSARLFSHLRSYSDGIQLNGSQAYTTRRLTAGDCLNIHLTEFPASEKLAVSKLPLSVVYEDEDVLVIDKPAGMPVHPSMGHHTNTVANACAWHYRQESSPFLFRAINRLDRDSTGLMLIAKNPLSAAILGPQAADRQIRRTYLAAAFGEVPPSGTIDAPIARVDGSTIERCVDPEHGERSVTHYERLQFHNGLSLVKLRLETGRTHQIRVHMKHICHPLPGDFLYCPDFSRISRQALHSWQLEFTHPITGEQMCFTAELPDDMKRLFHSMENLHQ